jgi:hypothetical protein
MSTSKIGRLCQSVLPPEFERVRRQLPEIQDFLEQNLPEAVNRSVTLLQQLRETFGLQQSLKFRTIPDSMLKLERPDKLRDPKKVSADSIDALERNAKWIEDDGLKAAILSLAESLKNR